MAKKLKIVGMSKDEFDNHVEEGKIFVTPARLIPTKKPGGELALTSVFLSSMRLIEEFRKMIFSEIGMAQGKNIYVYTEVGFSGDEKTQDEKSRIDGLVIVVKSGKIQDAALFEMKNGNNEIEAVQIEKYLKVAQTYSIPKLVSVSNQFVSEASQYPVQISASKELKEVSLFHMSWTYILTVASILLYNNDTNIEDEDQVEIMKEMVAYFEDEQSKVSGFNAMKEGWKKAADGFISKSKIEDSKLEEAVSSWIQEEKDIALILSRHLGLFVKPDIKRKGAFTERLKSYMASLKETKELTSCFKIKGAVSDIIVTANMGSRTVEMAVSVSAPKDKSTIKGQVGWLQRQQAFNEKSNNYDVFESIKTGIQIEAKIKNSRTSYRYNYENIDKIVDEYKSKEITEFNIIYVKDFGKDFTNKKKFVETIEKMILDFYVSVIQNLKNWEKPAPKIKADEISPHKDESVKDSE